MNLYEWSRLPWQTRNKLKAKFGVRSSQNVKTISVGGDTVVEDDGVREGDIASLADVSVEEALAILDGKEVSKEVAPKKVEIKEEKVVESAPVKRRGRPKKK